MSDVRKVNQMKQNTGFVTGERPMNINNAKTSRTAWQRQNNHQRTAKKGLAPFSKKSGLRAPPQKFQGPTEGSRDLPPPLWDSDGGSKLWQGQVFLTLCPESSAPGICVIFLQSHNGNV